MTEAEWLAGEDPAAMLGAFRNNGPGWENLHPPSDRKLRLFCAAAFAVEFGHAIDPQAYWGRWADGEQGECALDPAGEARSWCEPKVRRNRLTVSALAALLREVVGSPFLVVEREHRHPGGGSVWSRPRNPGPGERLLTVDDAWLTPTVLSIAKAAYGERPGRECEKCRGRGRFRLLQAAPGSEVICPDCKGAGHIDDGALDPDRLAILADALEEAGCPPEQECPECEGKGEYWHHGFRGPRTTLLRCETCPPWQGPPHHGHCGTGRVPSPLLTHLRSPGPHVRGCWALDLVLGLS